MRACLATAFVKRHQQDIHNIQNQNEMALQSSSDAQPGVFQMLLKKVALL
jgi:hypothetical protein